MSESDFLALKKKSGGFKEFVYFPCWMVMLSKCCLFAQRKHCNYSSFCQCSVSWRGIIRQTIHIFRVLLLFLSVVKPWVFCGPFVFLGRTVTYLSRIELEANRYSLYVTRVECFLWTTRKDNYVCGSCTSRFWDLKLFLQTTLLSHFRGNGSFRLWPNNCARLVCIMQIPISSFPCRDEFSYWVI